MKKKIAALALVFSLATVGFAAARGGYGGYGMGYHTPQMQGPAYQQLDQASQDKVNGFFLDTQELRKQIFVKQAEKQALLQGTNPDPAAVAKVSGELFDLRVAMQDKAKAAGVDSFIGGRGFGMGMAMADQRGGGRGRW